MTPAAQFWQSPNEIENRRKKRDPAFALDILKGESVPFRKMSATCFKVGGRFNYWPSTGRFIDLVSDKRGCGVRELILSYRRVVK